MKGYIGADLAPLEHRRAVTGRSRFIADLSLRGEVHMFVVRSVEAQAEIRRVDLGAARAMKGVVAAFSAADVAESLRPIPIRLGVREGLDAYLQRPLATDRVRYVGEPVAVVLAENRYVAEDAADAVHIDYAPLRAIASTMDALSPDAPLLFPGTATNIVWEHHVSTGESPDDVFSRCDVVVHARFKIQRHTGVPLETRGVIADYDPAHDRLTLWGATKVPHWNRAVLARMLGLPESRVRLVEPQVGGGFGIRGEFYPEDFLAALSSRMLGRPVKWIEDRREHFLAANHSRQQEWEASIGASADGRILALKGEITADMGSYLRTHGTVVPALSASILIGPYRVPSYDCSLRCVLTNKTPTGTYRAPGRYEANFVRERLLDLLARRLQMDRVLLREKNLVTTAELPYDTGVRMLRERLEYDSGDYLDSLRRVADRLDWPAFEAARAEARARGAFIGVGIAPFIEKTGYGPFETARIELDATGRFVLTTGLSELGQNNETTLAQICADVLQTKPEHISVIHGDTDRIAVGVGTFGSRGVVMGGNAAHLAAGKLRDKILRLAAQHLSADPSELTLDAEGVVSSADPSVSLGFAEIGELASRPHDGDEVGLEASASFSVAQMTYSGGTHGAVVEVDPATGEVKLLRYVVHCDVGRIVNPLVAEGQVAGGAAQGIGGALLEELVYSPDGQLLTTSFMDYLMPTASDIPEVETEITQDWPSPLNPLGVKGIGEGGIASAAGAIANAVADALREFGVEPNQLPLAPAYLLAAITRDREVGGTESARIEAAKR